MKKSFFTLIIAYIFAFNLQAQGTVLAPGDIAVVQYQADDPDAFGLVTFVPITAGTTIYITDCGATSNTGTFINPCDEGARKFVAANALEAGDMIFYSVDGTDPQFTTYSEPAVTGNYLISTGGDQVVIFQDADGAGGTTPFLNPTFIFALTGASTQWTGNPTDKNESSLPTGLVDGVSALAVGAGAGVDVETDNAIFNTAGMPFASIADAKAAILNTANWFKTNNRLDATYTGHLATMMNQANVLPVDLLDFTVAVEKNTVDISWTTANEINNKGFEIQYSTDRIDWEIIDFIDGGRNSELFKEYNYQHKNPKQGTNYYRLKQLDYDGAFEFSKVEVIHWNSSTAGIGEIILAPNPTNDLLNVSLKKGFEKAEILNCEIFNQMGQLVQRKLLNAETKNFTMNVQALASGFYVLEIRSGGIVHSSKFIKE